MGDYKTLIWHPQFTIPDTFHVPLNRLGYTAEAAGGFLDNYKRIVALRQRVIADRHLPLYHFVAPEKYGWPFDPNGAIYWNGRYHIFYIFQDTSIPHGGHCWGHASTTDLINWKYHPPALVPREKDPEIGIFSGGAFVNKDGIPTIIYHGLGAGTCIATSEDEELIYWTKSPFNPVIPEPKEGDDGFGRYCVFDPHAWVEGDKYFAILGNTTKSDDIRDTAYLFESSDLVNWEYVGPFYEPRAGWTYEDEDCACPDFFPLGDKFVLMCISHPRGTRYYTGIMKDERFIVEEHHRMNWPGGPCFASESLLDEKGRRIFWAWARDQRKIATRSYPSPNKLENQEFMTNPGVMTIPRVISISSRNVLEIHPAVEMEKLRHDHRVLKDLQVPEGSSIRIPSFSGDCIELNLEVEASRNSQFVLKVCCSKLNHEETAIIFDSKKNILKIDTSRSSLDKNVFRPDVMARYQGKQSDVPVQEAPFGLESDELLKLRVFLDRSILEVFSNNRQAITQRIYPINRDSTNIDVQSIGGSSKIVRLDLWQMRPSNLGMVDS